MQDFISYVQGEKIGTGLNGDVYNCYQNDDQAQPQGAQQFAIKVFKTASEFKCEEEVLAQLNHPNVIKILQREENKMLMKFYENGDLFDFLQKHGKSVITEEVARYFFKQLITAIQYIHSQNIIHRDIKLENILIDENFNLILSDFGLSTKVDRGQMLSQYLGTSSYMAPEIVAQSKYYGQSSDIFALGVILFCIMIGTYPFQTQAVPTDNHYKYFANKNFIRYWLLVEKQQQRSFSTQFKSLINQMLTYDPNERITIEEIWEHDWMTSGPTASIDEIRAAIEKLNSGQPQPQPTQQEQQPQENTNCVNQY